MPKPTKRSNARWKKRGPMWRGFVLRASRSMPLEPGSSESVISHNIKEMRETGHPERVAVAAAEHNADKYRSDGMDIDKLDSIMDAVSSMSSRLDAMERRRADARGATLTPAIARAAGQDAGNRSMKKAGRTSWNEDDWNAAAEETNRLMAMVTRLDGGNEPGNGDEPYGSDNDAGYADPGYRGGEKRYPLKKGGKWDAERIHAAWDYIHVKKNADEYSAHEREEIEGHIKHAWREAIDKDGPPEAEEKK